MTSATPAEPTQREVHLDNPFTDQKPGTSGLRKSSKQFEQPNYLESFIEAALRTLPGTDGGTLVVGGDGRYGNVRAIDVILRMAAAHGLGKVIVTTGGILSTPAASHLIRSKNAIGGIILSASHNPVGPDGDFGVKVNGANGGPTPASYTDAVFECTITLSHYSIVDATPISLKESGQHSIGAMSVEVIDGVDDFVALMQQLFDFDEIKGLLRNNFPLAFDAMHAVTGAYATRILEGLLGAPAGSVRNGVPLEDFGKGHPDPNLKWASELVRRASLNEDGSPGDSLGEELALGVAFDGDGDRNMIVGHRFFASPSDSLAVLAAQAKSIKWFKDRGGLAACARSMPTSRALDRVAEKQSIECYETPTGWKFFGNLMELKQPFLCGEESFGTGADHVREKDGLWAALAWLSVLADNEGMSVGDVVKQHWKEYGRDLYCRHDYEEVASEGAQAMMAHLGSLIGSDDLPDPDLESVSSFSYVDPLDSSSTENQGMILAFRGGGRCVFRLSGTGSAGATVRVYIERPLANPSDADLDLVASEALEALADKGKAVARLHAFVDREGPSVIT